MPTFAAHEVQVSIRATGLCGSDLYYYAHGRNGNFQLQAPLVLGHGASGAITAIPDTATNGHASSQLNQHQT